MRFGPVFLVCLLGVGCTRSESPPAEPVASSPPSAAASPSPAAPAELRLAATTEADFYASAGEQLAALRAAEILPAKTKERYDYVSYYAPRREVRFHGAKLLWFEHEYLEQFIGCCVNDGFGLILQGRPTPALEAFAAKHRCAVKSAEETFLPQALTQELQRAKIGTEQVFELSCRAGDTHAVEGDAPSG